MPTSIGHRAFSYGPATVATSRIRIADHDFRSPSTALDDAVMAVYAVDESLPTHTVTFENCSFQAYNQDDAFNCIAGTHNILCINCDFMSAPGYEQAPSSTAGKACNVGRVSPIINVANWLEFRECRFNAFLRCPDIYGGVVTFIDCVFEPSARNTLTSARCNFIRCTFRTTLKPSWATFWDSNTVLVRPLMIKDGGAFHFEACSLNGSNVTGPQLCRAYSASPTDSDVDVSSSLFYSTVVGVA